MYMRNMFLHFVLFSVYNSVDGEFGRFGECDDGMSCEDSNILIYSLCIYKMCQFHTNSKTHKPLNSGYCPSQGFILFL